MSIGKVQEKIRSLNNVRNNPKEYLDKCDEIIRILLDSNEIYTLASKDSSEEFIKSGRGDIRYGIHENIPTMWLFSEEKIAKEYADYYNLKLDGEYLIKKIPFEELSLESYRAMFSGVGKLIVDEGREYLACSLYDLVNQCLIKNGQDPILERKEYLVMNILNSIKYGNAKLWVVPKVGTTVNDIIFNNFAPAIEGGSVRFFINKNESSTYSKKLGHTNGISIDLDMTSFNTTIENLLKGEAKGVKFIINNIELDITIEKLNSLLSKMN